MHTLEFASPALPLRLFPLFLLLCIFNSDLICISSHFIRLYFVSASISCILKPQDVEFLEIIFHFESATTTALADVFIIIIDIAPPSLPFSAVFGVALFYWDSNLGLVTKKKKRIQLSLARPLLQLLNRTIDPRQYIGRW